MITFSAPARGRGWGRVRGFLPPLKGEVPRVSVAEGPGAVRRIPIGMHRGEFAEAPLASPGGKLADLTALRNRQG